MSKALEIAGVRVITITVVLLVAAMAMLPSDLAASLVRENGPVETATAAGFIVAAVWLAACAWKKRSGEWLSAGFVTLLLGMRELDFHARFTTMGVFKTRYYISPEVPLPEKAIVSVIMVCLVYIVGRFLYRNTESFITSYKAGHKGAVVLALAIVSGFVAKIMDSMSAPLRKVVGLYHSDPRTCLRVAEETVELAIPLFICLSVYYYLQAKR